MTLHNELEYPIVQNRYHILSVTIKVSKYQEEIIYVRFSKQ